ncbi:MAG TPA: hypothetical protein VN704_05200 [Verrucomicrobiae bacterium]|nr:hypothetical protein [Verrucomicrobiae bacterium]
MSVEEIYNKIAKEEPGIKLLGILNEGNMNSVPDSSEIFDENVAKLSFIQTPHILEIAERFSNELGKLEYISYEYDNLKLFDLHANNKIVTVVATKDVDDKKIITALNSFEDGIKEIDGEQLIRKNYYDDFLEKNMLNYIEFMKELAITTIHTNEKMLKSFWKKFGK